MFEMFSEKMDIEEQKVDIESVLSCKEKDFPVLGWKIHVCQSFRYGIFVVDKILIYMILLYSYIMYF